jgi:CRISPR-associated protein Cmr6
MSTRRASLTMVRAQPDTHAGLWLDKYIDDVTRRQKGNEQQGTSQARIVEEVAGLRVPRGYAAFFERWQSTLTTHGAEAHRAKILGRMAVGLGAESVLETAIVLHRTYGVPMIPGSALKGLAAASARQVFGDAWVKDSPAYTTMFGNTETAGYVTFFDALYIPGSAANDRPLAADVLTVHHQAYYNQGGDAPADWDSPVPVPFLSAAGTYLIALQGPPAWVGTAFQLLAWSGAHRGVGAKTSSGYGRFLVAGVSLPGEPAQPSGAVASAKPASGPVGSQSAAPNTLTRAIPKEGSVFAGKVLERGASAIVISVPGHPPEAVIAVLKVAGDTPGWQTGDLARVEVTASEEREGRTILTVRRAPKKKKS